MNANLHTYYNRTRAAGAYDSDSIRKAYLAKARRRAIAEIADSRSVWTMIFALKIISGIICAIGFFSVIGLIEAGSISPLSGIFCTLLIALLESLCFIPMGKRPRAERRKPLR